MKRIGMLVLAVAMSVFVVAVAQQQPSQSQPSQPGMMSGGMGMIGQMGAHHQQMIETMNKLMQSMSAIEAEKDPAALNAKLAAHRALLEQMHSQMMQQGAMMQQMQQRMQQMMGGSANAQAPPSK